MFDGPASRYQRPRQGRNMRGAEDGEGRGEQGQPTGGGNILYEISLKPHAWPKDATHLSCRGDQRCMHTRPTDPMLRPGSTCALSGCLGSWVREGMGTACDAIGAEWDCRDSNGQRERAESIGLGKGGGMERRRRDHSVSESTPRDTYNNAVYWPSGFGSLLMAT